MAYPDAPHPGFAGASRIGWQEAHYDGHPGETLAPETAALVVINPNSPAAEVQNKGSLLALHRQLCGEGILGRLTDEGGGLRVGLPLDESQWQRFSEALPLLISYS